MTDFPLLTPNLSDLYHVARKAHWQAKQKGEESHQMLAVMGTCMVGMGAMMLWRAFNKGRER